MAKPKLKIKNEEFRRELSGAIYQIKIILLLLWQGLKNNCKFRLRTEVEDAAKFDDALFYHLKESGKFGIKFLQMKHARFDEARLTYEDFVNDFESSKCNLRKYFISFRKILQQFKEEDLDAFILCTNIPFSALTLKRKNDDDDKALIFEEQTNEKEALFDSLKHGEWKQYKLSQLNDEVKEIFKDSTNLSCLAEEIINCIIESENEGKNEIKLDIRNYWFSLYHFALFKDSVIEEKENVKLDWKFINGKTKGNEFQTHFMNHFKLQSSLKKKEIEILRLDKKFKEVRNAGRKQLNQQTDLSDFKNLATRFLKHFILERTENFDDDPILKEVTTRMKEEYHQNNFDKNLEIFCANLQEKLPDMSDKINCLRKREEKVFPKLLVDHLLGVENIEIIEAYLSHPTLFNQLKDIIRVVKEYAFTDNFINGKELNENVGKFHEYLLQKYQNILAENLVHEELMANQDFIKLLNNKVNNIIENGNIKILAKELASHIVNKKILINSIIFEEYAFILKHIFEVRGNDNIIFSGSFLNISQKQLKDQTLHQILKELRHYLLKSYAIQKLRIKTFSLTEDFGKRNCATDLKNSKKNVTKFAEEVLEIIQSTKYLERNTNILIYDKTKYGKDLTNGLIEALHGSVFKVFQESGTIKFHPRFFDIDETSLPIEAVMLKHLLKAKLTENDFDNLKNKEIRITNNSPFYEKLEEIGDIDEDIKVFCEKLMIVNTPNETVLTEVIEKEVSQKFNLIDTDIAADYLLKKILNWAKEKEERFLNQQEAENFLKDIQQKIITSMLTGTNSSYCAKLRSYNIEFKKLLEISLETQTYQKLNLKTDKPILTAIKVEQTLRHYYKDRNNYNIISTDVLLPIQREVLLNMESTIDLLIIVDNTKPNEIEALSSFWRNLCSVIENNSAKKVILIGKSSFDNSMFEQVLNDDSINYDDLTKRSQTHFRNMSLIFQGMPTNCREIFSNLNQFINYQVLAALMDNGELKIGKPLELFSEDVKDCYIKRKIKLKRINHKMIKNAKKNQIFLVEGVDETTMNDMYAVMERNKHLERISEICELDFFPRIFLIHSQQTYYCATACNFEESFKYYQEGHTAAAEEYKSDTSASYTMRTFHYLRKKHSKKSLHWLKLNKNDLYLYHSYIPKSISKETFDFIKSFAINDVNATTSVDESCLIEQIIHDRVLIISDKAGIGKTTILTSFAQKLKDMNLKKLKWKIRINLNIYTQLLSEINETTKSDSITLNFGINQSYEEIILTSIIMTDRMKAKEMSFEDYVFKYCFENGKMLIIFDGFDEISPNYENYVMELFVKLKSETLNQMWITSRTNFKKNLEEKLQSFAYNMKPFDKNDQKEFLKKFWNTKWEEKNDSQMQDQNRLEKYVDLLLTYFNDNIGTQHANEIGIPLQTKMLAEIFQENCEANGENETIQWHGCFGFIADGTLETPEFADKMENLLILYETFVRQKILTYFLKEKQILDLSKPFNTKLKHTVYNYEQKMHQILGLITMTDNNPGILLELPTESEKEEIKIRTKDFRTENVGLIDLIAPDGTPLFNHLSYAEYFAACYLKEKLILTPKASFTIMNYILKKDVPVFLYCIKYFLFPLENEKTNFDLKMLHQKLNETTIVNYLASSGFYYCLRQFFTFAQFRSNMKQEKTILHCAVEGDQINILLCLLSHIYGLFEEQDPAIKLLLFLKLLDNYEILNEREDIARLIKELKNFCEYGLKLSYTEDNQILPDALQLIPREEKPFFLSSNTNFFNIFSYRTIKNIIKYKNGECFEITTSPEEFVTNIFANKTMPEKKKLKILEKFFEISEQNQRNVYLQQILQNAIKYELNEIFLEFMTKTSKIRNILDKCFILACRVNNLVIVKKILSTTKQREYEIEEENSSGNNPLHIALYYNASMSILKFIVEDIGIKLNSINGNNETPLLIAVKYQASFNKIQYLLSKGSGISAIDKNGKHTFAYAVKQNNDHIIKLLLAIPNLPISQNCIETMNEFYNKPDFDINLKTNGLTRLHRAINAKEEILSEFLITKSTEIYDDNGKTPLDYSCDNEMINIKELLEDRKKSIIPFHQLNMSPENKDESGKNIIHLLVIYQNSAILKELLDLNMSIDIANSKDKSNKTPLIYAMENKNFEIIKILLFNGTTFVISNINIGKKMMQQQKFSIH